MRNALIDIGSNTIRLVIYDNTQEIKNVAEYAGLITDVKDGEISAEGIAKIIRTLIKMKKISAEYSCDNLYAFATASLRGINDKENLVKTVEETCGIKIHIISGDAEAQYDYEGLKAINNVLDGAAFDLGGGSCELMVFYDGVVVEAVSVPIGSLMLYTMFVTEKLPGPHEIENISAYVLKQIRTIKSLGECRFEEIYAMGGAVFALCSLDKEYFGGSGTELTSDSLNKIMKLSYSHISKSVPKRVNTIIPAAVTMLAILKYSGAKKIIATPAGVRDGILYKNLLFNSQN